MNKPLERTEVEYHDLKDLVAEAQRYLAQLEEKLSDIKVPVRSLNPEVLEAIRYIFGEDFVKEDTSFITFRMFLDCMDIMRNVGRETASEFV